MYNYSKLPTGLQGGMQRYIEDGYPVGHFLMAVLSNDLLGAISRADDTNIKVLPEIVRWIYNEAPVNCWGSEKKVNEWHKRFKEDEGIIKKDEEIRKFNFSSSVTDSDYLHRIVEN